MIDMLIGAALGVAATYLLTHPDKRSALFSRVVSLVKQEYSWVSGLVKRG